MARFTTKSVTKAIREAGHPYVELVRGNGYHYFVFDDGKRFETESVMTMRLTSATLDQWVEWGLKFAEQIEQA